MELYKHSALEIRNLITTKKATAQEVVADLFKHIEQAEPSIKAYLTLTKDSAIQQAKMVDEKIRKGDKLGRHPDCYQGQYLHGRNKDHLRL